MSHNKVRIWYTLAELTRDLEERLKSFFKQSKSLMYKRGDILLTADTKPPGIFFLIKGYVRNYVVSNEGEEFTFIIHQPGDFFPFSWTFNESRMPYFFESMTSSTLHQRSRKEFLEFLSLNPDLFLYIASKITRRMDGLMERMEHMAFGNAYKKVCSILYILSERFGNKAKGDTVIDLPLTHHDLANLLGITRETVSIEIAKLKKEKIIANKGNRVVILDPGRLRRASQIT